MHAPVTPSTPTPALTPTRGRPGPVEALSPEDFSSGHEKRDEVGTRTLGFGTVTSLLQGKDKVQWYGARSHTSH